MPDAEGKYQPLFYGNPLGWSEDLEREFLAWLDTRTGRGSREVVVHGMALTLRVGCG